MGKLEELIPFYDRAVVAIEGGELDTVLAKMQQEKSALLNPAGT